MARVGKTRRFELGGGFCVRGPHGTELQVSSGKLVRNARDLALRALG